MKVPALAWLREHADAVVDPAARLPFGQVRDDINLKRLELLCWLGLANEVFETSTAAAFHTLAYLIHIGANIALFVLAIVLSRLSRRIGSPRLRAVLTPVFVVALLLMWQSSMAVLAEAGRLSTAYPMIIMTVALVFVWPPRLLLAIMAGTFATFVLMVLATPAPAFEQTLVIRTALLSAFVAMVAGMLIYAARERDYLKTLALHERNEALQRRNAEMDEVMAFAAHDLRSPLLGLGNLLAFAEPRIADDPALASRTLKEASRSVSGMLVLIGRLLDAHEAEHGRLRAWQDDLRLALTACRDRNRTGAEATGITLSLSLPEEPVVALFDPHALERILDNLVSNAVRFSPRGSTVTLVCDHARGRPRLLVADEGIGLPQGEQEHLFEKFRRSRAVPPNGSAGTGLGLFIVGMLVERIGGQISYRPGRPRGSVFELTLQGPPSNRAGPEPSRR